MIYLDYIILGQTLKVALVFWISIFALCVNHKYQYAYEVEYGISCN